MLNNLQLGQVQTLTIVKTCDFGVYLASSVKESEERVLLPKRQIPENAKINDTLEVFLYKDSEDRLIATTTIPPLTLGTVALLKVKEQSKIGAFLDWGLAKDLLLPFKEQTKEVSTGDTVLAALYIDKSNRLAATMKVYDYLRTDSSYQKDDMVTGTIYETSDEFGIFVAVDNQYSALIPKKECYGSLKPGQQITARVTSVKADGKLDLSLRDRAHLQMDKDAEIIMKHLQKNDDYLPFNDKSDAESIKSEFNLSKNAFKRAVGKLLKEKKIIFMNDGIQKL